VIQTEVDKALTCINNKPRKILGYKSSLQIAKWEGIILDGVSWFGSEFRARGYFPKSTDFRGISHGELKHVQYLLNGRSRKVLGFHTPYEEFNDY